MPNSRNNQRHHRQSEKKIDHSGRAIYADPRTSGLSSDQPVGVKNDSTAASIAATIGWRQQNQQSQKSQQSQQYQAHQKERSTELHQRREVPSLRLSLPPQPHAYPKRTASTRSKTLSYSSSLRISQRPESTPSSSAAYSASLKAATTAALAATSALYHRPASPAIGGLGASFAPFSSPDSAEAFSSKPNGYGHSHSHNQRWSMPSAPVIVKPHTTSHKANMSHSASALEGAKMTMTALPTTSHSKNENENESAVTATTTTTTTATTANTAANTAASLAVSSAASALKQGRTGGSDETTSQTTAPPALPTQSNWGASAANQAFHSHGSGSSAAAASTFAAASQKQKAPVRHPQYSSAATPQMIAAGKQASWHRKSHSAPDERTPAISANTNSSNALTAATAATAATTASNRFSFASEAGSVPYTTMDRKMFTATPPVALETEEQKRNEFLHASAVAMAKRMYNPNASGSRAGDNDSEVPAVEGLGSSPFSSTLQDAAYRLAQERLDRLEREHQQNRSYRDHYVGSRPLSAVQTTSGTLSGTSRFLRRRRSSSEVESIITQSSLQPPRPPYAEMSSTSSLWATRQVDRQSVLAAAQRNVRVQMESMDEEVLANTGQVRPSLMASWEHRAAKVAHRRSSLRLASMPQSNEVDIGGGRFMKREEIDEIAAKRVQPLLDDINEKVEHDRLQRDKMREDEQQRKLGINEQKIKDRESKALAKKTKNEEKAAKKANKKEAKAGKANDDDLVANGRTSRQGTFSTGSSPTSPTSGKRLSLLLGLAPKLHTRKDKGKGIATGDYDDGVENDTHGVARPESGIQGDLGREDVMTAATGAGSTAAFEPAMSGTIPASPYQSTTRSAAAQSAVFSGAQSTFTAESPTTVPDSPDTKSKTARVMKWIKARFTRPRAKSSASGRSFIGGHTLAQSGAHQGDERLANGTAHSGSHNALNIQALQGAQNMHNQSDPSNPNNPNIPSSPSNQNMPNIANVSNIQNVQAAQGMQSMQKIPSIQNNSDNQSQEGQLYRDARETQDDQDMDSYRLSDPMEHDYVNDQDAAGPSSFVVSGAVGGGSIGSIGSGSGGGGSAANTHSLRVPPSSFQNPSIEDIASPPVSTPGSTWAEGTIGAIGAVSGSENPSRRGSGSEKQQHLTRSVSPLELPPQLRDPMARRSDSPRDSRFLEDLV